MLYCEGLYLPLVDPSDFTGASRYTEYFGSEAWTFSDLNAGSFYSDPKYYRSLSRLAKAGLYAELAVYMGQGTVLPHL
ncbi:MAG: hypothetical protein MZW92_29130 [Comamonadaceae bacterium]|nr:hypothetical protein [Comamonadaceae bacterium]